MVDVDFLIVGVTGAAFWLPVLIWHAVYLKRNVEGHIILGDRKLVHRLVLMPIFRVLCAGTFVIGQLLMWSTGGEHWLGMIAAFRILSVLIDRFVFYGLVALCWKSFRCARAGFSRNEARSVISLVLFTGASDLIWLAATAEGQSSMPTVVFRTAFYTYCCLCCRQQGAAIARRVKSLEASVVEPMGSSPAAAEELNGKLARLRGHLKAHRIMFWFGTFFGTYSVAYLIAVSLKMLPAAVGSGVLWEEMAYALMYLFLVTCIYKGLTY